MDQLTGSDVQVVLSLKHGKGFQRISNPTNIVATLNGQSLETGSIEPDSQPFYVTDLVWKADKNILRKMRSGHEPLKIECFEIKDNGTRDKIGHIILSLRTARILTRDSDIDVPVSWHKFCNLRNDVKAQKPEISLTLTIEEHEAYVRRKSLQESTEKYTKETENMASPKLSKDNLEIPYLVEEECLIQLGPLSTCQNIFLINIISGSVQNLNLLTETSKESTGNYSLWYRIFENDVLLKSFGTLEKKLILNERAVIKIRSSLKYLRNYLREKPNFLLILQKNETILGHSEIDLRPLIPPEVDEENFFNEEKNSQKFINNRCFLNKQTTPRNIGDCEENDIFLDIQLNFVSGSSSTKKKNNYQKMAEARENFSKNSQNSNFDHLSQIQTHRNPCGDSRNFQTKNPKIRFENSNERDERNDFSKNYFNDENHFSVFDSTKNHEPFNSYCLNVKLNAIKLIFAVQNIEFRFHHPKAEVTSTLYKKIGVSANEKLRLQDVGCKLNFISSPKEIRNLLTSFPPRISIREIGGEKKKILGQTILDVDLLFSRGKPEVHYEASLYDVDKREIGIIDLLMYLENNGPYHKTEKRKKNDNFGPPIMDDSLAYKIVEELEIWKERQQEIFLIELKNKEERHLNRLSEEWQKRRENLESKLACSVEQCKILANSLNMATEDLRTRRLKNLEKEARLIKANEDLQWTYEKKIHELEENAKKIEQRLTEKITLLEDDTKRMETELEFLRSENDKLVRLTNKQAEEIENNRKGSLTQDQTATLIQEVKALEQKLENMRKSKSFFKEQWGKAVREIHRMKMEHQQAIEVQIKTSKDELKNLDLEEILCADSSSLTNDQIMLGQIQKEIDVIKPRSSLIHIDPTSHRSFFQPLENSQRSLTRLNLGSGKSDDDERLRKLIEERDSLLKTGSYTNDDAIIIKLNTEIRSLLISN